MLLFVIFFPILMGGVCYALRSQRARNLVAVLTTLAELAAAIVLALGPACQVRLAQICSLGLSLELDGFRKVYCIVIAFLWLTTTLLSGEYFEGHTRYGRYVFFNLLTLGATMGVFLAADLFTALVFFEVMSFTSFPWVAQEETPQAIRAANTYLAVAVIGGLAALMGLFLLQNRLGTTELSQLYALASACPDKGTLYAAGGCILFGFGAKAGMFPMHIWLPKAHPAAPAPASALLSGVLTKSGIWGIVAISCNIFRYDPAWGRVIVGLGTVTMVLGAVLALFSVDLKRTLACSSMSQIGFILIGVGVMGLLGEENALAARGALLHMVNHSLFKQVLFSCAGVIYLNLHRLNLNDLRGFGRRKPLLMGSFLLGALGIGGIPLFSGYISKTLLHEGLVEAGLGGTVEWLFLISGGLTLAYMTKLFVCIFVERHPEKQAEYDANRHYMRLPTAISICLPAVLIPVLGLTAHWSMDGIAALGTDFFHAGALTETVSYFSLESLKGAGISLVIGAAVYFLIVRRLMMADGRYVDRWPAKLDLEELIYRPLLLRILPAMVGSFCALFGENKLTGPAFRLLLNGPMGQGGDLTANNRLTGPFGRFLLRASTILSHAFLDLPDALVYVLRRTFYRDTVPTNADAAQNTLPYRLGDKVDHWKVYRHEETEGEHRYAKLTYRGWHTLRSTTRRITGNLSFALLMLCVAVCIVLVYVFTFRY